MAPAPPATAVPQMFRHSTQLRALCDRSTGNADFARRGSLLVENGRLELGPFAAVPLTQFGDWEANPLDNRSWQWRLNWLSFLPYLLAYHRESGDVRAMQKAFAAARSWLDHFGAPDASHPFEFAWHDHASALRLEQLALLVHYAEAHGLWPEDDGRATSRALCVACAQHAELLFDDRFFSRHTNHGLEQARVLLLVATALQTGEYDRPARWRQRALERIEGELRHAFTDEGVHVENSPAYHNFVFKLFLGIFRDYPTESLGPLGQWLSEVGPRALDFLTRVLRPDGLLPIIGDTEALPVTDGFKAVFDADPAYEHFRYAISFGRAGTAPQPASRIWPRSGYAVLRSEWPPATGYRRALHVVFKAGASSQYHRQQDDGHLVLYNEGEDWLIDSGMFGYDKESPIRQYVRSRWGHNVVVLDRAATGQRELAPTASWRILAHSGDAVHPFVVARSEAYANVAMTRRVALARQRTLRVEDMVSAADGQSFNASFLWHVPADKQIEILGSAEVLVRSTRTARMMRLRVQGDLPDKVDCRSGVRKDRVLSVVSKCANSYDESQVLVFSALQRTNIFLLFEFSFEVRP